MAWGGRASPFRVKARYGIMTNTKPVEASAEHVVALARTSRPGPQPGHAIADYNSPAQHPPPAVFEPATRRLDDVGRAFIEVCPRRRAYLTTGFDRDERQQTVTNCYQTS